MKVTAIFSEQDKRMMLLALQEAERAFAAGNYPVGAVLTVDGELIGQARNAILTEAQTTAHAEQNLLRANSARLRQLIRADPRPEIGLYTTLEPCLMCLGVAVLHQVSRIVVACPDPHGGASGLDPDQLGIFYRAHWPLIETGLLREKSAELLIEFLKTEKFRSWETMLEAFTAMKAGW